MMVQDKIIAKKEYMGNREIRQVRICSSVHSIGDWAFCYCSNLEIVYLPGELEHMGDHIFQECHQLKAVYVGEEDTFFKASIRGNLLSVEGITLSEVLALEAKEDFDWIPAMDQYIKRYIDEPDIEGYIPFLAGGEEDYEDESSHRQQYLQKRRREKLKLIFARLYAARQVKEEESGKEYREDERQDVELPDYGCAYLEQYMNNFEDYLFLWNRCLELNYHQQVDFYEFANQCGMFNPTFLLALMENLDDDYVEIKSYILRQLEKEREDVFGQWEL